MIFKTIICPAQNGTLSSLRASTHHRTNLTEKNFAGFTVGGLKYIMPKNHVSKWLTHPDLTFNLDKFGTTDNVIFVTGLYGAGKTYTAERLAQQHHALHLRQDWLCWSEQYDSPESKFFVELFQKLHPETQVYFTKQQWRTHVDHATMQKYRRAYDQMMLDYIAANPSNYLSMKARNCLPASTIYNFYKVVR